MVEQNGGLHHGRWTSLETFFIIAVLAELGMEESGVEVKSLYNDSVTMATQVNGRLPLSLKTLRQVMSKVMHIRRCWHVLKEMRSSNAEFQEASTAEVEVSEEGLPVPDL